MLQVNAYSAALPFQYPFTISKGTKTSQPALLVCLGFGKLQGWGEAPAINYYGVTVDAMMESLQKAKGVIERYALQDPKRFWHFLHHLLPEQHFLIAALDIAGWDLFCQLRRQPLYKALGLQNRGPMLCDYTIGLGTKEEMLAKLQAHPAAVYKLKLSTPDQIELLIPLRAVTTAPFRVDVNEGWNYEDTLRLLPDLKKLGVEMLEQPLPKTAWEEMQALKEQSPIPLFADEACVEEEDVAKCAAAFHGINIKLTKCGGITPALRMIEAARSLGLQVMLGSMNESTIGTSAFVHMTADADFLDADGPLLLSGDYADGLQWTEKDGRPYFVGVSDAPGLGIRMRSNWQQYIVA